MKYLTVIVIILCQSVFGMNNYNDPRVLLSFMDRNLNASVDILRVNVSIENESYIKFRVMLRGEPDSSKIKNFLIFNILQSKKHKLLIPFEQTRKTGLLELNIEDEKAFDLKVAKDNFSKPPSFNVKDNKEFYVKWIDRGVEVNIPVDWVNFGEDFSYDAFTVEGDFKESSFVLDSIYDQAAKGGPSREKHFPAMMLFNTLCVTRR